MASQRVTPPPAVGQQRRSSPIRGVVSALTWLAVAALLVLLGYGHWSQTQAQRLEVYGQMPPFVLTDQYERTVSSDEFRGKVLVANFIYTNCPDICPLLSFQMKGLQERLRQEHLLGTSVQLLSFTVDPARDTPAVLRAYAERYQADPAAWRFLTGPEAVLVPLIVEGFSLGVQVLPPRQTAQHTPQAGEAAPETYEVMHSGRFVLIDRQGYVRAYYEGNALDRDRVLADIRQLLR